MDLPIPDYDQLPLTDLRHRIRALDEDRLRALFDHETAHGNRIPVLEVLHARLRDLRHGAEPSGGDPANAPAVTGTQGGSRVEESTAAEPGRPGGHLVTKGRGCKKLASRLGRAVRDDVGGDQTYIASWNQAVSSTASRTNWRPWSAMYVDCVGNLV